MSTAEDLDDVGPKGIDRGSFGRGPNKHQWNQAVPINVGKLNELSIFAKYGSVLGTDPGNITIWERQNEIVCSPWNWAKTMSTGSAGILEGGVEGQYLELGRSMHTIWIGRISEVALKGKLSCCTELMYAVKAFVVLMLNLWQPLIALPAILYIAILIAQEFGSAGGFLVIALFNDVMFGEEMDLLRFYYGGKIKWGLQLEFGFWDFLKRGFREVVGEESDICEAISTQDEADFGRKHAIHRFVINLFQTAVSYAEYVLVIGTGLSELLADIYWEGGGSAEFTGETADSIPGTGIEISVEDSPTSRFLYLIPGVLGVAYSVLIFWILVIFEIVFVYHCVILVPRTTGKETTRSVYGDIIAGICKGRVVFRGCALSRMWLLVRGYVKKTNHKSGNVVDACDEMKTFMLFLHWLGDNGWISAKMEDWTICKIKSGGDGIDNTAFLEEVDGDDDDEETGLLVKKEKDAYDTNNPMTEVDGFREKGNVSDLELTESVKGSSDAFKNKIQSIKKSKSGRKSRAPSNRSVHSLFENWLEGSIDTKERAAFGFSEYLVGTVSWLLGVEQILANVGHKLDENGKEVDIYKIHKNYEKDQEYEYTSHRWLFDGKAAVKNRIGKELMRGGMASWLKLALADSKEHIPYKDGDLGRMIFGGVSETHELRKSEIYELDELKAVLGRKVRAKWLAGGIMLVTKNTTKLSNSAKCCRAEHYACSVTFGTAELEEIRNLGRLWPEETARWRELVRKWDMTTQDAVIYGQEQVTTRRGNRIIAAILSVNGDKVTITVRKTMLPLEDQGNDIWCIG